MDANLAEQLADIVGAANVRTGDALHDLDPRLDPDNLNASALVFASTTDQIARLVSVCNKSGISIVPHGGRTSLAGAATSQKGQLVIDLSRMNAISQIDPAQGIAICEAGVTLSALSEATALHGLSPGIDIGARDTCTIGGMASTNAGGGEAFRRGVMRHRILGLEAVLPDGTVMSDLKSVTKSNEGYDIKQLLIGAEGTLGIITRLVIKLVPAMEPGLTFLGAFETAADAVGLLRQLEKLPEPQLLRAEAMWGSYARVAAADMGLEELIRFCDAPLYVLFELSGLGSPDAMPDNVETLLGEALESGMLKDAVFAKNEREIASLWRMREDSWAIERTWPHGQSFDISVPLNQLDTYMNAVTSNVASVSKKLGIYTIGHLGDGNLHIVATCGKPISHLRDQIYDAVIKPLKGTGGSFSAEHGIGLEKKQALAAHGDPGKLQVQRAIKRLLDPNNIMNPGKVVDLC